MAHMVAKSFNLHHVFNNYKYFVDPFLKNNYMVYYSVL